MMRTMGQFRKGHLPEQSVRPGLERAERGQFMIVGRTGNKFGPNKGRLRRDAHQRGKGHAHRGRVETMGFSCQSKFDLAGLAAIIQPFAVQDQLRILLLAKCHAAPP